MGISLVPAMAVSRAPQLKFVRIADSQATRTIGALTLRGRSLSRARQAFLSSLRQPS
jgi:LysR family hydrogen peroxide-inducible transcriptional activator